MKVLLISSKFPPEYSGSGIRALRTYQRLSKKYNIEYEVLCNSSEPGNNKKYIYEGVSITLISTSVCSFITKRKNKIISYVTFLFKYYSEAFKTLKFLNNKKFDLIHSFGNSTSVAVAAYMSRRLMTPMVIELCNMPITNPYPYLPVLHHFVKSNFHQGKVFVAISKELESVCKEYGYNKNVWCRPNPINKDHFYVRSKSDKNNLRGKYSPFNSSDTVLVYIAKFRSRKNHIFLLDVLSRLPNRYKLVLAGPPDTQEKESKIKGGCLNRINEKIRDLGLNARVHMIVGETNVSEVLGLSDLFLFPSWNEGLGTVMIESFGCGIPVIANIAESAFRQWIKDGENGFICELDPDRWVDAIMRSEGIDAERRNIISNEIYSLASSDIIDEGYYKIFNDLICLGYKGEVNIEQVRK